MAKLSEIFQLTEQGDIITELKSKRFLVQPDTSKIKNELEPTKHDVFDPVKRPDKRIKVDAVETENTTTVIGTGAETSYRMEKVARVGIAIQKLIVKRAVAFLFGNEVAINAETKNDKEKIVLDAVKKILKDNKSSSLNRKVARNVFSCTEAAELWFPVPVEKTYTGSKLINKVSDLVNNALGNKFHSSYGFKSKFKLRNAIFSPLQGDTLYPYFDETGDMIAFSREYQVTDEKKLSHQFFETYTNEAHYLWQNSSDGWNLEEGYPAKIEIGKIPIIYAHQDTVEWADVQNLIDRLEKLLSNFGDTNDYHAAPKIFTKGEIKGFSKKGESGAIIEGDEGADAKYLSWEQAPETVKFEKETLLNFIYTLTQTPDVSFDSVKGVDATSGIALKLLFMDAHLKVKDKQEIFDEYMKRRVNVIKAFIAKFNTQLVQECEDLEIEPEITPFMIEDQKTLVEVLTAANGSKALVSQKLAAKLSGLAQDPDADFNQIQAEAKEDKTFTIGEPTETEPIDEGK